MTNPPSVGTGSLFSAGSTACMADASGNLLFYSDGATVYNSSNAQMANGTGLNGAPFGISQPALAVKQPGNTNIYYIFTLGLNASLEYSVIDMSLSAGSGSVTSKNNLIAQLNAQKVCAVKHCNNTDIWILSHDLLSNSFNNYLLTAAGLNTVAVVSTVGTYTSNGDNGSRMKFSPNGKKLACVLGVSGFEVYDFDRATGTVSNPNLLTTSTWSILGMSGVEFSPDGTKLYGTIANNWVNNSCLFQWDLCAGTNSAVAASMYTVVATNTLGAASGKTDLQLAPDGKIYIAIPGYPKLSVINNPNVAGSGCNLTDLSFTISPNIGLDGLPNFMASYFERLTTTTLSPFTYTANIAFGCQTAKFTPPPVPPPPCPAANGYSLTSLLWNFGDPGSGAANTTTLLSPGHTYSSPGTYTAQLLLYYACGAPDTLRQQVLIDSSCISVKSTSITCASLGSATVTVTGAAGPFSYTWMPTAQNTSVATNLSPGTYTIFVFDAATNLTYTHIDTLKPSVPLTGYINNSDSVHCFGAFTGTANVTGLSGGSGSYIYAWSNGVVTYTISNPTSLVAGNWTVLITDSLTGCTINGGFFIRQPPPLNLTITASSPSVCVGGSIALSGTLTGGTPPVMSYSWTGGPASANYTVIPPAGNPVYSLTATDSYSCSITQTIGLASVPYPTLSVLSTSICPLETGTLIASGASSYSWNGVIGTNSFTASPPVNTLYTILGSAFSCTASATASIIIKPLPNPTIIQNSPLCEGSSFTMNATGGTAYLWRGPLGYSSSSPANTLNPVQLNQAGLYQVTVTAANSCTAPASTSLTVKPLPIIGVAPSNPSICLNTNTATLIFSGIDTLLSWSPVAGLSSTSNLSVSAFPQVTTVYTLTGSLNSCTSQTIVTVTVVPPPSLGVALSSPSMCAQALSGSPNIIVLSASGANTYTLYTAGHIGSSNPSGPTSSLSLMPPYQPTGPETATLLGSNGVCTISKTVTFVTVPNPTISVSNPTPVICAGESYTYTSSGASSFTWSASTPGSLTYTSGDVVVASPTVNSVLSVIGDSLGCFSAVKSSSLTVNPLPTLTINPNPARVCLGSAVALTAYGTGTLCSWAPNSYLNQDIGITVYASPPSQQSYTVTSSLRSCTTTGVVNVSVMPLPTAYISAPVQSVCVNGLITLQGSGGVAYYWSGPSGIHLNSQNETFPALSPGYSGIYTLTVSDENGCQGSAQQAIIVYTPPAGGFNTSELQGCAPFCTNVSFIPNVVSASITSISWQVNGQSFDNHFLYCASNPGNYALKGQAIDIKGCVSDFSVMVTAYPKPKADYTYLPDLPVEGLDVVKFNDASKQAISWSWIFGSRANTSTLKDPDFLFDQNGNYPVILVVTNQFQCSDTAIKVVTVIPDFAVYIPNAFTPNDDGLNDLFGPVLRGAKDFSILVFDRWGEKLFQTTDLNKGWDGTYKGEPCQEGVYVWKLEVSPNEYPGTQRKAVRKSGEVLLYR